MPGPDGTSAKTVLVTSLSVHDVHLEPSLHLPFSNKARPLNFMHSRSSLDCAVKAARNKSYHKKALSYTYAKLGEDIARFGSELAKRLDLYRNGDWCLRDLVSLIPSKLWSFIIMALASERRRSKWYGSCIQRGLDPDLLFDRVWPVSNKSAALEVAGCNLLEKLQWADVTLVRRCLSILEQMVHAKTSTVGPIMVAVGTETYLSDSERSLGERSRVGHQKYAGVSLWYGYELLPRKHALHAAGAFVGEELCRV